MPEKLQTLVQQCWAPSPADRPDFHQICDCLEGVLATLPADKADRKKKGCSIM